jgi:hypothetical protein
MPGTSPGMTTGTKRFSHNIHSRKGRSIKAGCFEREVENMSLRA